MRGSRKERDRDRRAKRDARSCARNRVDTLNSKCVQSLQLAKRCFLSRAVREPAKIQTQIPQRGAMEFREILQVSWRR
jgi:hypothetical protein